jgi:hypothetical protein
LYKNTLAQNGTLREIRFAVSLTQTGIGKIPTQVTIPAPLLKIVLPDNNLGQPLINAIGEARRQTSGGYIFPHLSNFPVPD